MIAISIRDLTTSSRFEVDKISYQAVHKENEPFAKLYYRKNLGEWVCIGTIYPATKRVFCVRNVSNSLTWECRISYGKCELFGFKHPHHLITEQ